MSVVVVRRGVEDQSRGRREGGLETPSWILALERFSQEVMEMKTGIEDVTPTRRDMLKQLGLGAGVVMLGGTALTGSAAAKTADPHFPTTGGEQVARLVGDEIEIDYKIAVLATNSRAQPS